MLLCLPAIAHGKVIYDTWTSDNSTVGSYVVTVEHNASTSTWDFTFTVLPWDAEGRGLFVDLGDYDLTDTPVVSNVSWYPLGGSHKVKIKYIDKDTDKCGKGCTIKNLDPPLPDPDDEWELVFELGKKNYDGVQTFNFSVNDSALAGITDSDWGLMAVACAPGMCPAGATSCLATTMTAILMATKPTQLALVCPASLRSRCPAPPLLMGLGLGLVLLSEVRRRGR